MQASLRRVNLEIKQMIFITTYTVFWFRKRNKPIIYYWLIWPKKTTIKRIRIVKKHYIFCLFNQNYCNSRKHYSWPLPLQISYSQLQPVLPQSTPHAIIYRPKGKKKVILLYVWWKIKEKDQRIYNIQKYKHATSHVNTVRVQRFKHLLMKT